MKKTLHKRHPLGLGGIMWFALMLILIWGMWIQEIGMKIYEHVVKKRGKFTMVKKHRQMTKLPT